MSTRSNSNIICDLDGTIAMDVGRSHHLHKGATCAKKESPNDHSVPCTCGPGERDWKSYFAECGTDEPNFGTIEILAAMSARGYDIYILSGRSMEVSTDTVQWLDKHRVCYDYLQMRGLTDRTDDNVLKLHWAREFGLTPENTAFVLEDRTRVVEMWRANGYRCFQVAPGSF